MSPAQPRGRLEDERLLTGAGRYVADRSLEGQAWAHFLRSDRAHARIVSIDAARARAFPGVLAILTGEDVVAAGFRSLPTLMPVKGRGGMALAAAHRPVLALERVRFVGEPVAIVVAETREAAQDAAELIELEWEELPAVVRGAQALEPGAPLVHADIAGNLAFDFEAGDAASVEAGFARAARRVRREIDITRVVGNPMEPRGAIGVYREDRDGTGSEWTLYACTQGPYHMRQQLSQVLGAPLDRIRLVAEDVGGSFGVHSNIYPEDCAVLLAAARVGRPVKWVASRSETFVSDEQGRDVLATGELALDASGRMLGMRFAWVSNLGAYPTLIGPLANTLGASACLSGVYDVPACVRARLAYSHTVPTASYRGAGRPVMSYLIERLVDEAAAETGLDPAELRAKNLVAANAFPYRASNGTTYDCGDFQAVLRGAMQAADWAGFEARRRASESAGRLRGRGMACFIEASGAGFIPSDQVQLRFGANGTVTLRTATHSHGQGHETSFAQIVASALGVPIDRVRLATPDAEGPQLTGNLTSGSRSLAGVGSVLLLAARAVVDKARPLAAAALDAPAGELEFADGAFRAGGRAIGIAELAERHAREAPHPLDLDFEGKFGATFPNGCHVAEVEIDPHTGEARVVAYTACDDMGRIVNEAIVEGQVHGGIAQGAGQVFGEQAAYDTHTGQLVTGSFMDYAMPRADLVCRPRLVARPVPTSANPLGVKGAGEAGTTGSLPALMNAVCDALRARGAERFDMPASPARLWRALRDATPRD
ncbi:MAG: xanthine dehydrogenase family protein molybdopterin-binding subunit [Betaproteobacteria bacterium]|nr:xanthine dehydrogenase family protein molybdopterin-binding subunit [Betaproteobacteria bacterium]